MAVPDTPAGWSRSDFKPIAEQGPLETGPVTIAVLPQTNRHVADRIRELRGIAHAWQDVDLQHRPLEDLARLLAAVHTNVRALRDFENRIIDALNEKDRFADADSHLDALAALLANSPPARLHGLNHTDPDSLRWDDTHD